MKISIQVLTSEEKSEIRAAAMRILAEVGIRIPHSESLPALKDLVGTRSENGVLHLDESAVQWALASAPTSIPLFDQTGQQILTLGDQAHKQTRFGIGVTNLYYQEPLDDSIVPFTRTSFRKAVLLGNHLPGYDFISTPGILSDFAPEQADLFACLEMAASTDKPLVVLISHKESFARALDLITAAQNSRRSILAYFNPQTPLLFPAEMLDNLAAAVERNNPVILSNYGMLGASTPASLTGTLSLLLAELLAGLVLCQSMRAGAPVILGSLPAIFDMRSSQSYYSPHSFLINLAINELLADYGIPTCGTSGCEGGWGMDMRAAGELWLNHLTSILGGVDLVPFVGSIFNSKVFSPELVVYADTIIRHARQFSTGFEMEGNENLIEEIQKAGHGGHYLESKFTLENFRRFITADIFPRIALDEWERRGRPAQASLLNTHTLETLSALKPPEGCAEILSRGERLISAA